MFQSHRLDLLWQRYKYKKNSACKLRFYSTHSFTTLSDQGPTPCVVQPPHYDDPSHAWTSTLPAYLLQRNIEPREEEGRESLPEYECTVHKMGYGIVKREMEHPNVIAKDRSWKRLYLVLWETTLKAYTSEPTVPTKPLWSYTMHSAEASVALDYIKHRHVFRLRTHCGPQMLIRTLLHDEHVLWVESLQASINVSSDLDSRPMPRFIGLLPRRRGRDQSTSAGQSHSIKSAF
ncbi:hypothetical protein BDF14DRAFT_1854396 [Spinellus fusiger]|nr:hypothetical protein BDF14DRAFT_1854396 [Spinellus fusiger]